MRPLLPGRFYRIGEYSLYCLLAKIAPITSPTPAPFISAALRELVQ